MTRSKSFLAAASAALAVFPVFAEVDWTASPIIVNEGTRANPVVLSEAVTASAELHVGKNADGALELNGGAFSNSTSQKKSCIGSGSAKTGFLSVLSGSFETFNLYVGDAGNGFLEINGDDALVKSARNLTVANNAATTGEITVAGGGQLAIAREVLIGNGGFGRIEVLDGTFGGRGTTLGNQEGSLGLLRIASNMSYHVSENYTLTIGNAGSGILLLDGGSVAASSSKMPVIVRGQSTGYGLLRGWGTVTPGASSTSNPGYVKNNGLVIADGKDASGVTAERSLEFELQRRAFENDIENDSTNGWYAVNKGLLTLPHPLAGLPEAGDSGACTWGEAEEDDELDLVNSARVTFHNITDESSKKTGIYAFTGHLYAPDRSDVPALPGGAKAVGIWKFEASGLYETADVEFRYDHVKARRGVVLYQLNGDGMTWNKLNAVALSGHRAKVTGLADPTRMFAAVAKESEMTVIMVR